jgi:hypothetical protein
VKRLGERIGPKARKLARKATVYHLEPQAGHQGDARGLKTNRGDWPTFHRVGGGGGGGVVGVVGWVGNTIGKVSPDPVFENVGEPAKKRAKLPPKSSPVSSPVLV